MWNQRFLSPKHVYMRSMSKAFVFTILIGTAMCTFKDPITLMASKAYPGEDKHDIGTLAGDVQNWAILIQNYILQLASDGIKKDYSQSYLDQANYTFEKKNGTEIVLKMKEKLGEYFRKKKRAANRLADKVRDLYDETLANKDKYPTPDRLPLLSSEVYMDSDIPSKLPALDFSPYFKQPVSLNRSTIKIPDEVPRDEKNTIDTISFTARLDDVFKQNMDDDPLLRWQYFGSVHGPIRIFPGREWGINFAGFYNDYDPRTRPWYIAATSGPKDVVIVIDCSLSMKGQKFEIAKAVAKVVISTLTKQDYVNVICARASHWDEVGKWHHFTTEVLSCQQNRMVPATIAHRKDLIEKIYSLKAGGTSELEKSFQMSFDLLNSYPRTGCQSIIVFATDGVDTDGEQIRCGPGYYTRSGYVPGPICRYNWTKVWHVSNEKNLNLAPQARIFSYLIKEDAEIFPGKLACAHHGSLKKLETGENLISQMSNYFEFLSSNAKNNLALWTSPYLDALGLGLMVTHAIPVISNITGKTIGVIGVDATLDEIENFLTKNQWGTVQSFLINKQGETIFHPKLKPSTNLVDDPIFIPISQLERDKDGNPPEFGIIEQEMKAGLTGQIRINESKHGDARTYYYGALNESEYSFAYILADTDMIFRRSQEPSDRSKYGKSYYNLLIEYRSDLSRKQLPGVWEHLNVTENAPRYPGLRISYKFSTIFLPPMAHCDPTQYIYDDNLTQKTIDAHKWINSYDADLGCESLKQKFEKGVRADVLITEPIEEIWKTRAFESLSQVKWTNIGLRSGVFRTYPGHRSTRMYNPVKRPWYKRTSSAPHKTSISTPYMDAAGVGKIVTISQAVFEGMTPRTTEECVKMKGPKPGGCTCNFDEDCLSRVCYVSMAPGPNSQYRRCATERVEAVTGLDILYDDFQNKSMETMEASDRRKSCGQKYLCPDGEPGCQTRCYLFDSNAYLVMDPDFILASNLDESEYERVTLGKKEGEVMKDLIYKHSFFKRKEYIDFQGSCRISPEAPKVTLEGIPKKPEELDDYYKTRGPIPQFHSEFGCIQDVVGFKAIDDALGSSGMITGNVSGPCMSGFYYVKALPKTNLYLLVIENWKHYRETLFYNFNCRIAQSIVNSGAYRIINGTCAHEDTSSSTLAEDGKCPPLKNIKMPCAYIAGMSFKPSWWTIITGLAMAMCLFLH
ncbi:Hypothetical predicted protein [Octopus vulgaris]|uniref:VWFA domain-containing protein n=1 Tax=Octopus vulgaris TaxID=6645 RepID=A0AA36FGM6_OCTVU|nr:Hypothetical predicted protein [Octopus vulgaris]